MGAMRFQKGYIKTKLICVLILVAFALLPSFADDSHTITIENDGGGSLKIFNAPGAASATPTYSQNVIDAGELVAQMAGWTPAEVDAVVAVMEAEQPDGCYTAYFRADGSFSKCDDGCSDCEVITVVGSSSGSASLSLKFE